MKIRGAVLATTFSMLGLIGHRETEADRGHKSKFRYAVTMSPMFEKRFKMGEDNYVVRDKFICVTDGVGGWKRRLVDTGLFTKEYVKHIATLYDNGQYVTLKDLLDLASKMTRAQGSSTCVMAELSDEEPDVLKTCNLGDSGYMLLRPYLNKQNEIELEKVFRSKT
jgi:serine/threonine protein phosphatase PrpC